MKGREKICAKLSSTFLRKWWFVVAVSIGCLLFGIMVLIFFTAWVNLVVDHKMTSNTELACVYSALILVDDDIAVTGEKIQTILKAENVDVEPYWPGLFAKALEGINVRELITNSGSGSATSQSKHAARFLRLAMASIMDILKIKPFVEVSVGQLLWGYEDPLLKLAKDVVPKEQKLPYEEFGLMYKKNGTSEDTLTIFTGSEDISKYGLIDKFNGKDNLTHYSSDECNSVMGSDGSIFPPHMTVNTTIHLFDKDLCRRLPLVSDSPVLLSFPHFYLANDSYRLALDGISPPDPEKHSLYMDIQPMMGTAMAAKVRVQINLAVSQVVDIKQVATFPDIIFPIIWFEEGLDSLPEEMTGLMKLATKIPPIAQVVLAIILFVVGAILLVIAIWRIVRGANRLSSLHLAPGHVGQPNKPKDVPMANVQKY
nr:scavenger receptor class B member 1 [Leptinotarsa decemlineata]